MHGPRRHDSNVRPPPSEGGALTTELRRVGVDGRIRTCMSRVRSPAPDPFGHVDVAPPTGFAPVTSGLTDRRSPLLSYGGSVRVLGLEPSLFRGKSPVPYQSGVTRGVPPRGRVARPRGDDASAVVKELVPGLVIRFGTPGRSRTSGRRCWRPRRHRDSSACVWVNARMTVCARGAGAKAGELSANAARYQRLPGSPTLATFRRPDSSS